MSAPEKFVAWMSKNRHIDRRYGHVYRYHSRSDAHSIVLCTYLLEDLLDHCPLMVEQASQGKLAYGINIRYTWSATGKSKTLDLALGSPVSTLEIGASDRIARAAQLTDVFFSCEAKSVMTEHGKSQPRIYDELSSSHEIIHQGKPEAIATGIAVVNIARTFVSPLRQTRSDELHISKHTQPNVTQRMVEHLRGLPIRNQVGQVGSDAYCTIVIECDNQTDAALWAAPPAPQEGDIDHYETFIERVSRFYTERFSSSI